ncbi:hypothetical protein ACI68E_001441 [Malassezia pachydermatis]|uniref:Found in mitochondrial proteome protein 51 n=1 Tax=Malassezia pachydermatis TaxID=77020 RepID=A0A0M9VRA1_9BASI|nr:hypothetical protein Malapachy_3378 [Malassezia pachydermatis]KOS16369.1 hypothetical protein Malapachy_3378 [Malassezia pachydermatis]
MTRLSLITSATGALVAGTIVYAVHASMRDQTHFMVAEMRAKTEGLEKAEDFDKTSGRRIVRAPVSAYNPGMPTFWEEMKSRWNHYLTKAVYKVHSLDPMDAMGPAHGHTANSTGESIRDALESLAPHALDAQPKFGILHRRFGDENTHYMGQGASLR